ncbi:23S rRNA (uracil(1939)-C(5))-methyltransferase RlmD [Sansalvadorimonas verongulae]|uniref:23S rRNA (uracil(1939)-C(5))-methyltransferase RlmD n=1 Tax=Sansalvadorimonas verongulae TaxID=2172824 RepID=UPI0012BBDFC9|nr:23S rRNA (uracil(1939)-C(5))-methyltransferase RlmD [Sansalvadorimonas verongulae]MTI15169.1 23S rRNA (uracil(1939)-C(5))-methyltransferase RlmD [Sansalvadorimonas verongulae]
MHIKRNQSSRSGGFRRTGTASQRSASAQKNGPLEVVINSLTHDGRGVAREKGRVVFVEGAVPGDRVKVRLIRQTSKLTEGVIAKILEPSSDRVEPPCPWYSQCGGCNLQHLKAERLLTIKEQTVLGQLKRFGDFEPDNLEAPLTSPELGYRTRARLAVRWWNGKLHFGFRASGSKDIVAIERCAVLVPELSRLLPLLRATLEQGQNKRAVSHIELAAAENGHGVLLRTVAKLPDEDRESWLSLAREHNLHLYLQPESSSDSLTCVHAPDNSEALHYTLSQQNVKLQYLPVDFTQVNTHVNEKMVTQALEWLDLTGNEQVLDLFCGMGNFTLPLARACRKVVGVEGVQALVERGEKNALLNNIENSSFARADLAAEPGRRTWLDEKYDALLLDPPRTGALDILQLMGKSLPNRILYVSCNPATLARDAGFLKEQGYRLSRFCVMDMFPQTTHVESMGLFLKG